MQIVEWKELCLVGLYAPNIDDEDFFHTIKEEIIPYVDWPLMIAGDFNYVMDGITDRHPPKRNTKPNMTESLASIMDHFNCRDVWRDKHPEKWEYTCFTPGYGTHRRLD